MRRTLTAATALALLAPLGLLAPADAGPAGSWTTITGAAAEIGNIARPDSYRTPDGVLHVVYSVQDSSSSESLRHLAIGDDGEVLSSDVVVSDWDSLAEDPEIIGSGSDLRIVFSGLRAVTTSGDPYNTGQMYSATSNDGGRTWSLSTTYLTDSGSAYASYGTGAVELSDGRPMVAFPLNSRIRYNDQPIASAATSPDDPFFDIDTCCAYDVELARVPGTDTVYLSWFANGTTPTSEGTFIRQIAPTVGPIQRAPRSTTPSDTDGDGTVEPGEENTSQLGNGRTLVATSSGVYLMYRVGYPDRGLGVWKLGTDAPEILPVDDALYGSLAADSAGRVWAAWYTGDSKRQVFAARSNPAGTRFGQKVAMGAPKLSGEPSVWNVLIDARAEGNQADVVVNTTRQLMHQEVFAGLTLTSQPRTYALGDSSKVTFTVTDAGVAVPGATVKADGRSCTTNAQGRCTLTISASPKQRSLTAVATKSGFTRDALVLRGRK
ncbi:hypothetical protein GCM10022215_18460 [Nocardioides fonticola]|uniref:Big-1 domain-containing protein n=1 Tax=Nocardioides fonticola TaxID=450363 RepID=A0ABP7XJ00_9ACTN